MRDQFDNKLKEAMRPSEEPDFWLNQKIMNRNLEVKKMRKNTWKRTAVTFGAVGLLLTGSVGVTAALRYFTPDQVAKETENNKLAAAFDSKGAIDIDETQQVGGYDVTLLGMVSGKNLSDFESYANGELQADRTYAVVAIANTDGTKMQEKDKDGYNVGYTDKFFVSPFIEGYNPNRYNAYAFHGGVTYFVKDGVLYWLLETDNMVMFANHTIYLGVTENLGAIGDAYTYQEDSGKIEKNKDYSGVNALFTLPIDKSKASEEEAKKYMDSLFNEEDTDATEETAGAAQFEEDTKFFSDLTMDNIEEYAIREESTVQTVKPDKDGNIRYEYEIKGETEGSMEVYMEDVSGYNKGQIVSRQWGAREKGETFEIIVYNGDGTFTAAVYRLK